MRIEEYCYSKGYRITAGGRFINPKGIEINGNKYSGYLCTSIRGFPKKKNLLFHRMQSFQKYGVAIYEKGIVTRHFNGNKLDNSWDNILIGTQKENMMDVPENIRIARSLYAASFNIKYNKEEIKKYHLENGKSYIKTMNEFNISSKGTLHYILNN